MQRLLAVQVYGIKARLDTLTKHGAIPLREPWVVVFPEAVLTSCEPKEEMTHWKSKEAEAQKDQSKLLWDLLPHSFPTDSILNFLGEICVNAVLSRCVCVCVCVHTYMCVSVCESSVISFSTAYSLASMMNKMSDILVQMCHAKP